MPSDEREHLAALDRAMALVVEAEAVVRRVKVAMRGGQLPRGRVADLLDQALVQGVLTPEEVDLIARAEKQRAAVCQVDSFTATEYLATARKARGSDRPVSVSS